MSVTLEVSDGCGQFVSASTEIIVVSPPLEVTLPDTLVGTCTESFVLSPYIDGGSGVYTYEWSQNFNPVGDQSTYTYTMVAHQFLRPCDGQLPIVGQCVYHHRH